MMATEKNVKLLIQLLIVKVCSLAAELLRGVPQHFLVGSVDLDLRGADHADGDSLAGVDLGSVDGEGDGVERNPLQRLDPFRPGSSSAKLSNRLFLFCLALGPMKRK